MNWINAKERLPEAAARYIVCFEDGIVNCYGFEDKRFYWDSECCRDQAPFDDRLMQEVTHWMPLPKEPK